MAYFIYEVYTPPATCQPYVECYWRLYNPYKENKNAIILPDGRIDLIFSKSQLEPFHASLVGLSTQPEKISIDAHLQLFGVSFKLPGAEYVLKMSIAELINSAQHLPDQFWGIQACDIDSFEIWCQKISSFIISRVPDNPDIRKLKLFKLVYRTHGALTVSEYADQVGWSSRQINRYLNSQFGLSLKMFCEVLRFRAGVGHIQYGKLYPEENYTDQSHFIKEVKKLSGVSPRKLYRNDDDQFIQLLVPPIS